ncbi:PP2C family protein-serine/threonine phosphatase [Sporichthya sp.]|uniref:PP2C family protein-serine/threonine phosphatase n=1 Tax=Sporichthya sp. TaxID=65475 RepID=UPI0017E996EB|nr:SpoIIE family protein phosphatase [Sporichthya sp.]MBA3742547.1 SpoIIE family protein phosphatase [Sporichthya sp.]
MTVRHLAQDLARQATERLVLLSGVSVELTAAGRDVTTAVTRLAEMVVPLLGDWCVVSLVEGETHRNVAGHHVDPAMRPALEAYMRDRFTGRTHAEFGPHTCHSPQQLILPAGTTDYVLRTLNSPQAKAALTALAPVSSARLPMAARGRVVGFLGLARGADRPPMSADELAVAQDVADRAGLALENARLYAAQHSLAEGLQRSLLTEPPEPDHCQITVRYVPAAEIASVGGDWFDSFLQPDGATVLVIGDVMGHDTAAAGAMGQLRSMLRTLAWHTGAAPAEVLSNLDAAMLGLAVNTTATAVVARLEQTPQEREQDITWLRWSNAGHPPPMVLDPDGDVTVLSAGHPDLLLGLDPQTARGETAVALRRGSTVLLYTDGLVERRGQDLDAGLALLRENLARLADLPLDQLCDRVLEALLDAGTTDDVALIAVRLHPQDRPRPAEAGPVRLPPHVG